MAAASGLATHELDSGGVVGHSDDMLDAAVFEAVLQDAARGRYLLVVAGIPCTTFSVARFKPGGAPPVRWRSTMGHADAHRGAPHPPAGHEEEAAHANLLLQRTIAVAEAVVAAGGTVVMENPMSRSDPALAARARLMLQPRHAPLWLMEELLAFEAATGARRVHFPQCALGGPAQKWTTLSTSPGLTQLLSLEGLSCSHPKGEHKAQRRARRTRGKWATASLAAYPPLLNAALAAAFQEWRVAHVATNPPPPPPPPPQPRLPKATRACCSLLTVARRRAAR